jgi:hypothetical protein
LGNSGGMPSEGALSGLLVVVELGASWPGWLVEGSAHTTRRVVVELEGEGPLAFATRAIAVAATLMPKGVPLDLAVLACNERADDVQRRARRQLGRALLHTRGRKRTELVLTATPAPSDRLRDAMSSLEEELHPAHTSRRRSRVCYGRPDAALGSSPVHELASDVAAVA